MLKRFILFLSMVLFAGAAVAAVPAEVATVAKAVSTDGPLTVAAIGGAILTMSGIAILFKWAKSAIFG